ncbi:MAG: cation:dicarboxylase symporter family transporter [Acidobacteriota bacterium]
MKSPRLTHSTLLNLLALALGIALGLAVFHSRSSLWLAVADNVAALGTLWTNALRMTIIPLIVSTLIVAVVGNGSVGWISRVSGLTFVTFLALLVAATLFVLLVLPPVLPRLGTELQPIKTVESTAVEPALPSSRGKDGAANESSLKNVVATLLPSNLIKAAADDYILPIVLFTVLLGLALTRIEMEQGRVLVTLMRAVSSSIGVVIDWILVLMPVGVFAFSFATTATIGWNTIGILGAWIAIVTGLSVTIAAGLYLIAYVVGGVPIARFGRATMAAQGVALATRSSLASLPAMLEGVKRHLPESEVAANLVLPLSVSSFKLNRAISGAGRLLFLAHVYGISLSPTAIVAFVTGSILISFSSPGLPTSGPIASLPLYVAAGIPFEGIVLLRSVEVLADVTMTTLNVTGDMAAMTIVARFSGTSRRASAAETQRPTQAEA